MSSRTAWPCMPWKPGSRTCASGMGPWISGSCCGCGGGNQPADELEHPVDSGALVYWSKEARRKEVRQNAGKCDAQSKQGPADAKPGLSESRELQRDIYRIRCAIRYVREHGENKQHLQQRKTQAA